MIATPRPSSTTPNLSIENIPAELKALPQWVTWRYELRGRKWTKVPYDPRTAKKAKANDPGTWTTFQDALVRAKGYDGIGFVLSKDDPYVGIDLDDCIGEGGEIVPEAQEILSLLDSYAETSPSRRGVKVWIRGGLPAAGTGRRAKPKGFGQIEVYQQARFFTVTGWGIGGIWSIGDRERQLLKLRARYFQKGAKAPPPEELDEDGASRSDDELIERARAARNGEKFTRLWSGDFSGYPSQSEADLALCAILAFHAGRVPARIDRLFRRSGLVRPKWDERHHADGRTYGEATVAKAIGGPAKENTAGRREAGFHLTDLGNAERLVSRHGKDFLYSFARGEFLVWTGRRWVPDQSGKVMRFSSRTVRAIRQEALAEPDKKRAAAIRAWAHVSESRSRLEAMVALARSRKGIAVAVDEFDSDPWLFNCRNGTVDLRTGEIRPHRREDLITKLAPVEYRAHTPCPLFDAFLDTTFSGNEDLIEFVLRVLGMSLTADVREQHLYIFHGAGNNGKSVLLDTVAGLMGDYAAEAPPDLLADRRGERHPTEIADLCGRRLVIASETEEGSILRLQLVKRLTGNARIKGRFMRQDFFEFERTHKLVLVTNNKPRIRENTEAAWRRLRLVPFDHIVAKEQRDKALLGKLRAEWPGILAKLVAACIRWQVDGLTEPVAVLAATEEYRKESDEMAQFVADCCVVSPTVWVAFAPLREEYEKWCKERGMRPLCGRGFTDRLRDRGFVPEKHDGARGWRGVGLCAK